jgi:predicted heme/steroid binding protein
MGNVPSRKFTREELGQHDGRNDGPILIAYEGKVYDVSDSWHWRGGRHQVSHRAGVDQTGKIEQAPHGPELLDRVRQVGILVDD